VKNLSIGVVDNKNIVEKLSTAPKSGGGLPRPDKHKTLLARRLIFAFLSEVAYDLEGLAAGARQTKSGGGLPSFLKISKDNMP
jgi:hypothetical protein